MVQIYNDCENCKNCKNYQDCEDCNDCVKPNPFDFIDRVVGACAMAVLIAGIGVSIYMFKKK